MNKLIGYIFIAIGLILLINPLFYVYKVLEIELNMIILQKDIDLSIITSLVFFNVLKQDLILLSILGIGLILIGFIGSMDTKKDSSF